MGNFYSNVKPPDDLEKNYRYSPSFPPVLTLDRLAQQKPPDDLDNDYRYFPSFPPVLPSDRQGSTFDPSSLSVLVTIGIAFLLGNILLAVALLPDRQMLENHPMCGMTTGGKAECYFDCETTYNRRTPSIRLIKDLNCLNDCFKTEIEKKCLRGLIDDVQEKGVCNLSSNNGIDPGSGVYEVSENCAQYSQNPLVPNISSGTCKVTTEKNLKKEECRQIVLQQPAIILNTVTELINSACTKAVSKEYLKVEIEYDETNCGCLQDDGETNFINNTLVATTPPTKVDLPPFPWERKASTRFPNLRKDQTLPIVLNFNDKNIELTTKFNFNFTRNRYPWICSLRGTGINKDHFCAVNLLSVPPKPTIIVGPAHCTFICKNGKHRIPSCCCRTDTTNCSETNSACGRFPKVVEMKPEDAQVLCGEWEIGPTPMQLSNETYNIELDITEIIRHPSFNTEKGPIEGNDMAIFKVNDEKIQNGEVERLHLYPACISKKGFNSEKERQNNFIPSGIQAGWSEAPPFPFLNTYAEAYVRFYRDFFKQWHYKMDIYEKCEDPKNSTFGRLKCPSNTSYPPATVCAFDFAKQACFSPGESGSPLMTRLYEPKEKQADPSIEESDEIQKSQRFLVEGILSFVKGRGCDIFSNNPSAYTKLSCYLPWIANQYGMDYDYGEPSDPKCSNGNPGSVSTDPRCLREESEVRESQVQSEEREKCFNTPSNLQEYLWGEKPCIFPFYYNGRMYNECVVFTESEFVYPAFRCPVHNITTKRNGVNDFQIDITPNVEQRRECSSFGCQIFQVPELCPRNCTDPYSPLDPSIKVCEKECKRAPFSTCQNNCPGVGSLGIIGGGALAFAATATLGTSLLAPAGAVGMLILFCLMYNSEISNDICDLFQVL